MSASLDPAAAATLREVAPQALAALVRRHGRFDACEDAVAEAMAEAAFQWPRDGVPANPRGWLIAVAHRRLIDQTRSDVARRRREANAALDPTSRSAGPLDFAPVAGQPDDVLALIAEPAMDDEDLALIFLCCHPALSLPSQVALTLRAVGGLSTAAIAAAFLVPESTMAQRISRGKAAIAASGARFELPDPAAREDRLQAVLRVLYLIFNEGYASSGGDALQRPDLTAEAIRLTRVLHRLAPYGETAGLLALMLLTDSHRAARVDAGGRLVPLDQQDRALWDRAQIEEGTALIEQTLSGLDPVGPYQLQAAIAAVHGEARSAPDTDWPQIVALYRLLDRVAPGPMVTLNLAAATAIAEGPAAGLALLAPLLADDRLTRQHRVHAVHAHLLERDGDLGAAREAYRRAAALCTSRTEQRYLQVRAARLGD